MDLRNLWMPPGPREVGDLRMFMKILGWRKLVQLLATPPSSWSVGALVLNQNKTLKKLKGPVHFARGYVNPAGFDVPVHLEVCECHIDAKIFYPEAFFIKKS